MEFYSEAMRAAWGLLERGEAPIYDAIWRSLRVATLATLLSSLLGIPLGAWIALRSFRGKRAVIALFSTLMAVPTVVVGLLLYGLFTRQGLLGSWGWLYSEAALLTAETLIAFPVITRLSIAALGAIDPRVYSTLLTLGASSWQALLLSLREAVPGLAIAVISGYGRALSEVGAAMIVGGNIRGRTRTMTTAIALEASRGNFEAGLALGFVLLLLFLAINLLLLRVQDRS